MDRTARLIALVTALFFPISAAAQSDEGTWSLETGLGFTANPNSHMIALEASYQIDENWSLGPLLQLGYDNDRKVIAPSVNVQYALNLDSPFDVYVQGGIGGAFLERDHRPGDDNEIGFMLNIGGGAEYRLSETLSLTSRLWINGLPGEVIDEHSFFSWEVAGIKIRF